MGAADTTETEMMHDDIFEPRNDELSDEDLDRMGTAKTTNSYLTLCPK